VTGRRFRPALPLLLGVPWLAAVAVMAAQSLPYRGIWWDEAAQFWVSQGLSSYSPPFSPPRGLRDVARMNCFENLDPGGFTVLLRLWTAAGCGLVWLRALPLAFFAVASLALGALGWRLTRSPAFAVAAGAAPSLFPPVLYFAFEIRAYSMEMAGVAVGALALAWFHEKRSATRTFCAGLACAAFLTSRYSFLFAALALAVALWLACPREGAGRPPLRYVLAFAVPAGVIAAPLWWVMLGHQLQPGMRAGVLGLSSPGYTRAAVFLHGADDLHLLLRNLLSPTAVPLTAALFAAFVRGRAWRRRVPGSGGPGSELFSILVPYVVGLPIASAAASALGLYPWDISSRWSAYLVMLSAVAAVALAAEVRAFALGASATATGGRPTPSRAAAVEVALAALVVLAASTCALLHRQSIESVHRTSVAAQIDRLPIASLSEHAVFVAYYEVPMVRYLYEHGPYRGRPEYPRAFRFQTAAERRDGMRFSVRAEGIRFLVSALTPAEAQALFPDAVLRTFGPEGSRLLAVAVPAPGS